MEMVIYTDKKENKIFLIDKEIQNGAVAKSYMRNGFLINEEMRKYFAIYEEAVSHIWLCNCSILNFLICQGKFDFLFISVISMEICSLLSVDISSFFYNLPLTSAYVYIKYIGDCCLEEKFTFADVSVEQYVG
jgi:hypothetical protein